MCIRDRRGTELVSFLLTHENATAEQVHGIFWPGQPASGKKANDDRNGLLSKTRRWLGQNDDGEWYVPYITTGEYRLHDDVRSDWQDFVDPSAPTCPPRPPIGSSPHSIWSRGSRSAASPTSATCSRTGSATR